MSGARLEVGIIGCGRLTEAGYLPALSQTPGLALRAVADRDRARAERVAATASGQVDAFGDPQELVDAGVDAIVVASPASVHLDHAALAVEAGMPVLVEKPPAPDLDGAVRLARLGPLVSLGFNRRFDANARAVRSAIADRSAVDLELTLRYRRTSWNPHTVRDDVLTDLVPHLVDWTRWLAGQSITWVAATEVTEDRARLTVVTTRGRAELHAAADQVYEEAIVARAPEGRIARRRRGGPVAAVTDRIARRQQPHPLATSLAAQLEAFEARARGAAAPDLADAADGVATMSVIEAARRSAAEGGGAVDVAHHPEDPPC